MAWKKVDKDAFMRGLAIIGAADPTDRKAVREAIKRANAEVGITEPARKQAAQPDAPIPGYEAQRSEPKTQPTEDNGR